MIATTNSHTITGTQETDHFADEKRFLDNAKNRIQRVASEIGGESAAEQAKHSEQVITKAIESLDNLQMPSRAAVVIAHKMSRLSIIDTDLTLFVV